MVKITTLVDCSRVKERLEHKGKMRRGSKNRII